MSTSLPNYPVSTVHLGRGGIRTTVLPEQLPLGTIFTVGSGKCPRRWAIASKPKEADGVKGCWAYRVKDAGQ